MPHPNTSSNPYRLHRAALAAVLPGASQSTLENSYNSALELGETTFAEFLCQQGLAALWHERVSQHTGNLLLSPQFLDSLRQARLHATAGYMRQSHRIIQVREILDDAELPHVVTKGVHTRELYYPTPALRPATDIDLLVRPRDKLRTIKAFLEQGFEFRATATNIAQDCSLVKGETDIDVHWDILRPGRTRQPMVDTLLKSRVSYDSHWGMSHAATLFMMLVHPVFRKYSTTPHATLVRLIDLTQLLSRQPEAVTGAIQLLEVAGLKTAGWITAHWLTLLTDNTAAASLRNALAPGKTRQQWLKNWLDRDWSTKLLDKPWAIQLGLTLPAHDRWTDALRAMRAARDCKHSAKKDLALLVKQLS